MSPDFDPSAVPAEGGPGAVGHQGSSSNKPARGNLAQGLQEITNQE